MSVFRYTGRNQNARPVSGLVEADSPGAVAAQLADGGIVPISIEPARSESTSVGAFFAGLRRTKMRSTDLAMLARQLYSLTRAGVPILRSILSVAESARTPEMTETLSTVHEALRSGRTLAASLARHPDVFPHLFVSVVQVGEESGTLEESFEQLASFYETEEETRQLVKGAVRYPLIVVGAVVVAIAIINRFVVPAFANVFANAGVELPLATRIMIATSDFTVAWWPQMVVAAAAGFFGARYALQTERGRMFKDSRLFKIPVLGSLMERAAIARFARSFAIANKAGVPIIQSLKLGGNVTDNVWVAERIRGMAEAIPRGETLERAARNAELFSPLALQMIAVGEETGETARMMNQLASFYEREVAHESKKVGDVLEPLLVVFVGLIVLVLALGVYMPMWDLATAASK